MGEVLRFPQVNNDDGSYFGSPNQTGSPERRLLMAMMERAILDYVGNDRKELEAARDWIFETQQECMETKFTFEWVCQQLDLDSGFVRSVISRMPRRGKNRIAPWYFDKNYLQDPHAGKKFDKKSYTLSMNN